MRSGGCSSRCQRDDWRHHIITTTVEHSATSETCRFLERFGASMTRIRVDRTGLVDPDDIRKAVTPQTILISVMHANNEVGTIEPISEIGRIARERGIALHTDAAQSLGKISTAIGNRFRRRVRRRRADRCAAAWRSAAT